MGEIVDECARPRPDEIGEHCEIRREKSNAKSGQEKPAWAYSATATANAAAPSRRRTTRTPPEANPAAPSAGAGELAKTNFDMSAAINVSGSASHDASASTAPRYALPPLCGIAY